MAKEQASFFTVIVTGQVEFADVRPHHFLSLFQTRDATQPRLPSGRKYDPTRRPLTFEDR
jgi:hypothetical protein